MGSARRKVKVKKSHIAVFFFIQLTEVIKIKAFYIKEADKPNIIKQILNIIEIKNNELVIQPIKEKDTQKHMIKLAKKINKICIKKNMQNFIEIV